ncbi:uncharacterized protein LOC106875275 [Octopus bimaculoides]|uniref:uncharacterized protein LOC106875275 n=1 Tax=Octopus bimaculoides TaxID=37653 RepID=UPI0022DFD320|nr:uncharacterized protein LOC106875275 [Octopus bimaculoides]
MNFTFRRSIERWMQVECLPYASKINSWNFNGGIYTIVTADKNCVVMPRVRYPLKPWLIQYILNDDNRKSAQTLQVLQHCDGPLDDGTMVMIVGDGKTLMKAYFPKTAYENLEGFQRECWQRSLIKVTDWNMLLMLMDTKEKSDYGITIKAFDVWNNEEGLSHKKRQTPCKFDFRIIEKISRLWDEAESGLLELENWKNMVEEEINSDEEEIDSNEEEIDSNEEETEEPLTLLINALGDECFSPIDPDTLINHGSLEDVSIENLESKIMSLCNEDVVIKPEENKILEETARWYQGSGLSRSAMLKIIISNSKCIADNDNKLQQTTTMNTRELCIVPQPNTSSSSSSDGIIPVNPSVIFNQNGTNPEDEAQQQTISEVDETMTPDLFLSDEHQSENNLVAEDILFPSQSNPRITSHPSDSDIEEETRLHNLALPSDKAADQCDIQPADLCNIQPADLCNTQPADQCNIQPADQCNIQPADQFNIQPADQCNIQPADQCDIQPADQCNIQPADQCDIQPADQCDIQPADQCDVQPADQCDIQPCDIQPADQCNIQPADQCDIQPADQCDIQPADQCDVQPADQCDIQPADQCDIQPADQYENDHNVNEPLCSQDTVLTVTSTANDKYRSNSPLDYFENDLSRNVLENRDCDSSQESNGLEPSFPVTSTPHESCQLSLTEQPASSESSVFNYNADSNLLVPQRYSSNDNDSNSVNFNSDEFVTSTAEELHKPELRNTHHLNSNSNKRTFSTYQIDSLNNQSHENICQFYALAYASPSKRKHIGIKIATENTSNHSR